jgi:hypothetical protein
MTTFERIKQKCLLAATEIGKYEDACEYPYNLFSKQEVDRLRTNAAREIAELAQMISNAAKVTETITETE